jgi:hypothetical protein
VAQLATCGGAGAKAGRRAWRDEACGVGLQLKDPPECRHPFQIFVSAQRGGHRDQVTGRRDLGPQAAAQVLGARAGT